jgi:hypothetical protein
MNRLFLILSFGVVCFGCAVNKKKAEDISGHVLFSEYSEVVDGNVTLVLNSGTIFECDTNDVTIHVDGLSPEKVTWVGIGLGFKHLDRNNGRYLLIPNCKMDPKLIIYHNDKNGGKIKLKTIDLRKYM